MSNNVINVGDLTLYIKKQLENDPSLLNLLVKGEISNLTKHASGHWYFTLKDEKATIKALMFYSSSSKVKIRIENGMSVIVQASISVYEPSGVYQLIVKEINPVGVGLLYLQYEQLKAKLESQGYFLPIHKKPIPSYPKLIAVISALKGAAIQDVLTTIKRRYSLVKVIVIPSLVQGETAKDDIVKAIEKANSLNPSVIIIARGGGSIEDLWAFNEEIVALAIFKSKAPVISAIGHETDFTIADFVSSLRAPTPTAAAEFATPNIIEIKGRINEFQNRMTLSMKKRLDDERHKLDKLKRAGVLNRLELIYANKRMHLDSIVKPFNELKQSYFTKLDNKLLSLNLTLNNNFKLYLDKGARLVEDNQKLLVKYYELNHKNNEHYFTTLVAKLDSLSPLKVMSRGYGLILNQEDKVITSINEVKVSEKIIVKLVDGKIIAEVKTKE